MKKIIQAKNLSFSYKQELVLDDISFEIEKGEIVFIVGGNGSGKTTLLKLIAGLIKPDKGEIRIMDKINNQEITAKYVGYVPQYFNIERDFPISVSEVIELECSNSSHCPVSARGHLKYLDSEYLIDKKISDISGGEMQRVLIARSMVTGPELLLLDEPFNNLDHKTETDLIKMLRKINKERGITIIIVTHDLNIIEPGDPKSKVLFMAHKKASFVKNNNLDEIHKLAHI